MEQFKVLKDGEIVILALNFKRKEGNRIVYCYSQYVNNMPVAAYTFKYNLNEKLKCHQSIFTSGCRWEKYNSN